MVRGQGTGTLSCRSSVAFLLLSSNMSIFLYGYTKTEPSIIAALDEVASCSGAAGRELLSLVDNILLGYGTTKVKKRGVRSVTKIRTNYLMFGVFMCIFKRSF